MANPGTGLGEPVQGNMLLSSQEPYYPKDKENQPGNEDGQIILKKYQNSCHNKWISLKQHIYQLRVTGIMSQGLIILEVSNVLI